MIYPAPDPLTAARDRLTAAFTGGEVNEHLLDVFKLLQEVARDELAERLGEKFDLLLDAVRRNRRDTLGALLAYETALLAAVRTERQADLDVLREEIRTLRAERRSAGAELDRRLNGLEAWAYHGDTTGGTAPAESD